MKYYWKCPVCGEKVDFSQFIYDLFDTEDGEAIFAPSSGVPFIKLYAITVVLVGLQVSAI